MRINWKVVITVVTSLGAAGVALTTIANNVLGEGWFSRRFLDADDIQLTFSLQGIDGRLQVVGNILTGLRIILPVTYSNDGNRSLTIESFTFNIVSYNENHDCTNGIRLLDVLATDINNNTILVSTADVVEQNKQLSRSYSFAAISNSSPSVKYDGDLMCGILSVAGPKGARKVVNIYFGRVWFTNGINVLTTTLRVSFIQMNPALEFYKALKIF